jgi:hypothetical protein
MFVRKSSKYLPDYTMSVLLVTSVGTSRFYSSLSGEPRRHVSKITVETGCRTPTHGTRGLLLILRPCPCSASPCFVTKINTQSWSRSIATHTRHTRVQLLPAPRLHTKPPRGSVRPVPRQFCVKNFACATNVPTHGSSWASCKTILRAICFMTVLDVIK